MNDIFVRTISLPHTVRGVTVIDDEGDFNIYINNKLAPSQQLEVLEHEKRHIHYDDFASFEDIRKIERRAENK